MANPKVWEKRNGLMLFSVIFQIVVILLLSLSFILILGSSVEVRISSTTKLYENFTSDEKMKLFIIYSLLFIIVLVGLIQVFRFKNKVKNNDELSSSLPISIIVLNMVIGVIAILIWQEKENQNK